MSILIFAAVLLVVSVALSMVPGEKAQAASAGLFRTCIIAIVLSVIGSLL